MVRAEPISGLPLPEHRLRRALQAELHLRRFPLFAAPARVVQLVLVSAQDGFAQAAELCGHFGVTPPAGRHFAAELAGMFFIWERHTEFSSYSFIFPGPVGELFGQDVLARLPEGWLASLPGEVLTALHVVILGPQDAAPDAAAIAGAFADPDHVSCLLFGGGARIWSEFRQGADGLSRVLLHNLSLTGGDLPRLVQQALELGNYRNMALLGLPEAQAAQPVLAALEARVAALTAEITAQTSEDDALLAELSAVTAELAALATRTGFRMSATEAYAELTAERLRSLAPTRIPGFQTVADFTERRLAPGVRTCRSFSTRLTTLSTRANWASSLLRTRIETVMERQSRDLLASVDTRTGLQLRLQRTVEGLSVVAISYYATGLAGYVIHGLAARFPGMDPAFVTGCAVPVIFLATWGALRRMTRHLH